MRSFEVKNLAKQLLALVLVFSLVAGMQPAIVKAAEEQKTITNIALATADDVGAYTFYNGFNDNWYMAPGTELVITYSDGTERTLSLHRAFLKAENNSEGNCVYGQNLDMGSAPNDEIWDDYSPFLGSEYATSPFEFDNAEPFTVVYDEETNSVLARTQNKSFMLYKPQYKNVSDMPTLSLTKETVADGSRYMRFYRVSGTPGTAYETYTTKIDENEYVDTMLCAYKEDGTFVHSDDDGAGGMQASLAYRFTEDTPSYVIGLMGYSHKYVLHTKVYTKTFIPLKQVPLLSSAIVYPQFESCTVDYKLMWEDGNESEKYSIYATGFAYQDECRMYYTEKEEAGQTIYGLTGVDKSEKYVFTAFPSGTKVMTVEKNNTTNYPVYTAGTKVALKPGETKLMYMNVSEGAYFMANNSTKLEVMTYSLDKKELMSPFYDYVSRALSGEYAILVSNTSKQVANFRLLNLHDSAMTKQLPEYKPGQEVVLAEDEIAMYRFTAGSTYINEVKDDPDPDTRTKLVFIAPKEDLYYVNGYFRWNGDEIELVGEGFLIFHGNENKMTVSLKDTIDPTKNISGAAAKEEWAVPSVEQQQKPDSTQATPVPTTTPAPTTTPTETPDVNNKKTSIKGETVTVSKVTFKAISDSEAALNKVKKVKIITSYKVPQTITIKGNKVKVTTIDSNAFKGAKKLKKVTIASNVKTIKANAFTNCKKLKTVIVENANVKIKKNAFKGCKTITFKVKKSQVKKFSKMLKKAKIGCKFKVKKK